MRGIVVGFVQSYGIQNQSFVMAMNWVNLFDLDQRINIQNSVAQNESSITKIKSRHNPNAEAEM